MLVSSLAQGPPQRRSAEVPHEDVTLSFASVIVSVPP